MDCGLDWSGKASLPFAPFGKIVDLLPGLPILTCA